MVHKLNTLRSNPKATFSRYTAKILKDSAYFLMHGPLKSPSNREAELIRELRCNLEEYSVSAKESIKAENLWTENENELRELIRKKDPREFLRWNVIRRNMFPDSAPYIRNEFSYLTKNNWNTWKNSITETKVGCPAPFLRYLPSSENLIHTAYHLARFENQTKEEIKEADLIVEFGGGYGCMCRLIHNIGFKGKYVIFDLPVFSALQVFYLKMIGLNAEYGISSRADGISCVSKTSQIEVIARSPTKKSLFIATWSISETPVEARSPILKSVEAFDLFLIAYQRTFSNIDNVTFFDDWTKHTDQFYWYNCEITHIPNSYYLFGRKIPN